MRCSEPTATAPRTSRKRRRAERGDEEAEWFACACAGKMILSRCRCTTFSPALRVEAHHSAASLQGHRPHRVLAPCVRLDDLGDDSEPGCSSRELEECASALTDLPKRNLGMVLPQALGLTEGRFSDAVWTIIKEGGRLMRSAQKAIGSTKTKPL